MRTAKRNSYLIVLSAGLTLLFLRNSMDSTGNDITDLLDRIVQRLSSYPEMRHWQASVLSTAYEMDKDWKPRKKTVIQKIVRVKDEARQESIEHAVEIKDGKNKDVTQEYINKAYKEMENKARKKREDKIKDNKEEGRRHMDLTEDDVFPFDEEKRVNYDFVILDEASIEGIPVHVIETRAKQRSEDFFEGKYYVNRETFDILRTELQLAKNPGPLKRMEMEMNFQILPQGYRALKSTSFRIHVGLVVKNIRMEAVEEYTDYQILE